MWFKIFLITFFISEILCVTFEEKKKALVKDLNKDDAKFLSISISREHPPYNPYANPYTNPYANPYANPYQYGNPGYGNQYQYQNGYQNAYQNGYNNGYNDDYYTTPGFPFNLFVTTPPPRVPFPFNLFTTEPPPPFPFNLFGKKKK